MSLRRRTLLAATLLFAATLLPVAARPRTPDTLAFPAGARLLLTAQAEGVQIYNARGAAGGGFEWTLKAPDATLYDNAHHKIGRHYAGPTWEAADGSRVVGKQPPKQLVKAPQPGAVPWLLLEAASHDGQGVFSTVTYVLRVGTFGGAPPADPPTHADQETRAKYRATYIFLTAPAD